MDSMHVRPATLSGHGQRQHDGHAPPRKPVHAKHGDMAALSPADKTFLARATMHAPHHLAALTGLVLADRKNGFLVPGQQLSVMYLRAAKHRLTHAAGRRPGGPMLAALEAAITATQDDEDRLDTRIDITV